MNIVVTGAAGFIGRHTVAALTRDGHRVVGIDRRPAPPPGPAGVHLACDLLSGDERVRTALTDADAVVHLAGRPGVRDTGADADVARWRDNVVAGAFVCATTPPATPLIVASSSSVYGGARVRAGRVLPCSERQPLAPLGAYARSKVELERHCSRRAAAGGHVAVMRPFTVAGEGQRPDMALATWIRQARAGQPMCVLGSLERRRDVTDVRAVVHGIRRLLQTGHPITVNLGTGRTWTLRELTAAVAEACDVPHEVTVRAAAPVDPATTRADTGVCRSMLGFQPRTALGELVRRQAAMTPTRLHEVPSP